MVTLKWEKPIKKCLNFYTPEPPARAIPLRCGHAEYVWRAEGSRLSKIGMNLDVPRPVHGNFLSTVENRTQHYCQCRGSTWRAQLWIHDGRRTLWRPCASLLRTCACPQSASTDDRGDTLNYLDVVLVPRRLQRFVREKHQTAT